MKPAASRRPIRPNAPKLTVQIEPKIKHTVTRTIRTPSGESVTVEVPVYQSPWEAEGLREPE